MAYNDFSIPKFISDYEQSSRLESVATKESQQIHSDSKSNTTRSGRKCCWIPGKTCSRIMVLIYICLLGFFCLVCYDLPGSLQTEIQDTFKVQPYQFEYLYSAYCLPNIVLAYFGGILIDSYLGVKLSSIIVALFTLIGQILFTVGGYVNIFWLLLLARFIYGIGGDSIIIVIYYYSVIWFEGKGLNFVFGLNMSVARLGTSFIFLVSTYVFNWAKETSANPSIRIGSSFTICILAGLIVLLVVLAAGWESERNGKLNITSNTIQTKEIDDERSSLKEIFVYPYKYWLAAFIFVSLQTTVLVFVSISQQLMIKKYNVTISTANHLGSVFNLVMAGSAPVAGILVDRVGWNMLIINLSLFLACLSNLLMAFVHTNPLCPIVLFGISSGGLFSTVPTLMPKVVPAARLGSAFGLTLAITNFTLTLMNIVAGYILDYGYRASFLFFTSLLFGGLASATILWICDAMKGGKLSQRDYNS